MIIPASELISAAKKQCDCLDALSAKIFFQKHENTIIIDVREEKEVHKAKLVQSIHIPRGLLEMKIEDACPVHDTPVLLHCAAGGRASLSAYTLQLMGYSNVHVIDAKFADIASAFAQK